MTFMELRLIASEIESGIWKRKEAEKEPANSKKTPASEQTVANRTDDFESGAEENDDEFQDSLPNEMNQSEEGESASGDASKTLRGKTTVAMSQIQRPGYLACGTVNFGSGASAEWMLDQGGRLALDKVSGQPDQQDVQEFQVELRKLFGA